MDFLKLWNYSPKVLRAKGLFPIPIIRREVEGGANAGLKLLGSAYFSQACDFRLSGSQLSDRLGNLKVTRRIS